MDTSALLTTAQPAVDFLHKNGIPFIAGVLLSHPAVCADLLFKATMASPFSALVLKYSPEISTWLDAFQAEFDKQVKAKSDAKVVAPAIPPIVENVPPKP